LKTKNDQNHRTFGQKYLIFGNFVFFLSHLTYYHQNDRNFRKKVPSAFTFPGREKPTRIFQK